MLDKYTLPKGTIPFAERMSWKEPIQELRRQYQNGQKAEKPQGDIHVG